MRFIFPDVPDSGVHIRECPPDVLSLVSAALQPWIVSDSHGSTGNAALSARCSDGTDATILDRCALHISRPDNASLFHAVRRAIRQYVAYTAEQQGWVQIHASAVLMPDGNVILFAGDKNAGKTSSMLGLCSSVRGTKFVSNDRVLVHPSSPTALGWPTAVGIGEKALEILGLHHMKRYETAGKYWLWPEDIRRECGITFAAAGSISLVVCPQFTCRPTPIRIQDVTCADVLRRNIRRDALEDTNWWNIARPNANTYGSWLTGVPWLTRIRAITVQTEGLGPDYLDTLAQLIS